MTTAESWRVAPGDGERRLDRHVAEHLDLPRNQVQRWIRQGRVELNGEAAKPATVVSAGDRVRCLLPDPAAEERIVAEPGELAVLYEDPSLVVVDKPAGLTVHPGAGRPTGTLAHRLLDRYPEMAGVGGPGRPGIVHRLDKDTSGVMVAARSARAYRRLAADFAGRRVTKVYLAVVYGVPRPAAATIDRPIGRHPRHRKEMTVRADGRPAVTHFTTLGAQRGLALLAVDLATGRTHQIRVHLKSVGHPLVGDPVYGEARWKACPGAVQRVLREMPRPALHAWRLALAHPEDGRPLRFEAPPPADLCHLWEAVAGSPLADALQGVSAGF